MIAPLADHFDDVGLPMSPCRLLDVEPTFTVEGFARTDRYPPAQLERLVAALAQVKAA